MKFVLHHDTEKNADPFSIDFEPTTLAEASQFKYLLVEESPLRDMDIVEKSREELRSEFKIQLLQEVTLRKLSARLRHCATEEAISFVLLQLILCILHMENLIGIKILTMLFFLSGHHNLRKSLIHHVRIAKNVKR